MTHFIEIQDIRGSLFMVNVQHIIQVSKGKEFTAIFFLENGGNSTIKAKIKYESLKKILVHT